METFFRIVGFGLCTVAAIGFLGSYSGIVLAALDINLMDASVRMLLGVIPMQIAAIFALGAIPVGRNQGEQLQAAIRFAPNWFRILFWSSPLAAVIVICIGLGLGHPTVLAALAFLGACWFYGFHAMAFWAAAKGIEPIYSCTGGHTIGPGWTYCQICGRRRDEGSARL